MKPALRVALAATLLASAGCDLFSAVEPRIDEFSWEAVNNPDNITEGVTVAGLLGDISFLGQVKTPTLCYSVSSRLETGSGTLTVHIDAASSGSGACAQQVGGLRYIGVIRNLDAGTYTVKIIQSVSGVGTTEYTDTVTL